MFVLIIMLISTINSEPIGSNNHNIASYILNNIDSLEQESISSIANECYVSNSSISRFCRHIGLKDFNELKDQIKKYREINSNKFHYEDKNEKNYIDSYINQMIENMMLVKNSLDIEKINNLVNDIHQYENIYAFGCLQSSYAALNLQADMITNGKIITTGLNILDQINFIDHSDENDLIIIFSKSGKYFEYAYRDYIPKFEKNNSKIYMITMNDHILKYPFIDEIIYYDCKEDYSSHPYPLHTISSLISLIYSDTHVKVKKS